MAMNDGTSAANFEAEVDGVAVFKATEADGLGKEHEVYEIHEGNKEMPVIGRGRSKTEDVTLKGAFARTSAGAEFHKKFQDYSRGDNVEKFTVRVIQYAENSKSIVAIHECIECAPRSFKPLGLKGDSKDAAMFEVKFRPSDYECSTSG
ncbi:MAG TPA: phage tail protein [Pyrinomonadaceae bacterium]|jgi:hypothetical protein